MGKWEGAITRTSQRETKRRKERNYTMSRSQQTGGLFSKRKKNDGLQVIGVGGRVGEERTDISLNPQPG